MEFYVSGFYDNFHKRDLKLIEDCVIRYVYYFSEDFGLGNLDAMVVGMFE